MKALITGASSGIGKDIAREMSNKGYDLILVARREDRLIQLKEELNTNVEIIKMDLSSAENCKKLYEQVSDVDILVNNAGFGVYGEFANNDLNKELDMIDVNIVAVHTLTKLFLQDMMKKNKGQILNVASIGGFMPGPLMAAYYASKAYIVRLSEAIREELRKEKSNVKISILCPGPVKTEFNKVSGGKFNVHSLSSSYVAKYAVNKMLKGKFVIVPGSLMKVVRFLTKIVPDNILSKFVYYVH
mgnify:CR=1 FL=1